MAETLYANRRAHAIQNEHIELVISVEGGHIAAIRDRRTGVNPLWLPPWPSIEPSTYDAAAHPQYGSPIEGKLLSGILGHNLCLDLFGGPSDEEAVAGLSVHGEGSVAKYEFSVDELSITHQAVLDTCRLKFSRTARLAPDKPTVEISETVENLAVCDRPIAWTQHVTLGPPFLEKGVTRFESTATKSKTFEGAFSEGHGYMRSGVEFRWPQVPCLEGDTEDMRIFTARESSGAYSTHLMDPTREHAWFAAHNPGLGIGIAYVWKQKDFPWMGIWEENFSRDAAPWNGQTLTRGMEFGVSPYPESRRAMIERGSLFGAPGYRWVPAGRSVTVDYTATVMPCASIGQLDLP